MNKFILSCLLLSLFTLSAFAQRFSQYNTGSLYDSFENPAQRAFIPDSSKQYAFNFLIPNFNANATLTGNTQSALLQRAFVRNYDIRDSSRLQVGNFKNNNHIRTDANVYLVMFKAFTSLNGDQELGFSLQSRAEGRGIFTDQLVGLSGSLTPFSVGTTYNNILNNDAYYQAYNQFGVTYHEKVTKQFSVGFKLNLLLGIAYNKLQTDHSSLTFTNPSTAALSMQGRLYSSYIPGSFNHNDLYPNLRNPGSSITIGTMLRTNDGFVLQGNIKDLGFIHWSGHSEISDFNTTRRLAYTSRHEDSTYTTINRVISSNFVQHSFTTPVDGRAEFSASKAFLFNPEEYFVKYTPTLVLSKHLFNQGMEGALVNNVQYHNYMFSLTGMYDDLRLFSLGTQLMYKSSNAEFYIGSDALAQSIRTLRSNGKNEDVINQATSYSAASIYIGFSVKFGSYIEHPLNASTIPTGEKGFFGRLYNRFFKADRN